MIVKATPPGASGRCEMLCTSRKTEPLTAVYYLPTRLAEPERSLNAANLRRAQLKCSGQSGRRTEDFTTPRSPNRAKMRRTAPKRSISSVRCRRTQRIIHRSILLIPDGFSRATSQKMFCGSDGRIANRVQKNGRIWSTLRDFVIFSQFFRKSARRLLDIMGG